MLATNFVRFSDSLAVYTSERFDGYLSFLPQPVMDQEAAAHSQSFEALSETYLSYRYYSGKDFRWFEFRDIHLPTELSMQIAAPGNYLWLLVNLRTAISLALDSARSVHRDVVCCYQTFLEKHLISLENDSCWFLLLGIDGHLLPDLTAEYPQLETLCSVEKEPDLLYRIIGSLTLHAKLKRILDGLAQMEFRPFSTYYQLANWNIRFFRQVFEEIAGRSIEKTDHEVELYYKAIAYIRKNFYDDQINNRSIAAALHVTQRTLERAFQDKPLTITEQIIEFRLQYAKELIRQSDKPIATIAASLNFACPKNFKRIFTRRFMVSPLQYRESTRLKRIF